MASVTKAQGIHYRNDLTAKYVRSVLRYEPNTGRIFWRHRKDVRAQANAHFANKPAGYIRGGYLVIELNGFGYFAHRLIWLMMTGRWPRHQIDHQFRNTLDNRWKKLRRATLEQNRQNRKMHSNNRSGRKGVSFSIKNKNWIARIQVNKKQKHIGSFPTRKKAHAAYCEAAKKLHKQFARFH